MDLSKVDKRQAQEFISQFTTDPEVLYDMATTEAKWAHMTRIMARIAVFGFEDEKFDVQQLYIKERVKDLTPVDYGDPELAHKNAVEYLRHFVDEEADNLQDALKHFADKDGISGWLGHNSKDN